MKHKFIADFLSFKWNLMNSHLSEEEKEIKTMHLTLQADT